MDTYAHPLLKKGGIILSVVGLLIYSLLSIPVLSVWNSGVTALNPFGILIP